MPLKFNVFTGNFDQTGSGGGGASYIDGEVATYNDLPLDGTAALNSAWLVRTASGVWPVSRKQAGIYIRTATAGSSRDADYTYAGTMPDVFSDSVFLLYDEASTTRTGQFDLGSITAGQNRVLTWPDANGTIALTSGTTFTTLNATNGTITASAPVLDLAQTWNNASVAFTGMQFNVTNTASLGTGSNSKFFEINLDASPIYRFQRSGSTPYLFIGPNDTGIGSSGTFMTVFANGNAMAAFNSGTGGVAIRSDAPFSWSSTTSVTATPDVQLFRDAADTVAQRRSTNPQTFRIYHTFTDASNYERAELRWTSNVCELAVTRAGTGLNRSFRIIVGGLTAQTILSGSGATELIPIVAFGNGISFSSRGQMFPSADGVFRIQNAAGTDFGRLQFGGTTSSFPALKRSSTAIQVRLADDSAFAPLSCGALTLNGNLDASTRDIVTDTTTGTKIGTGTTQKLGFFNATPIVRPAAIADATDAATTQARLNDLLAAMRSLGLIAT